MKSIYKISTVSILIFLSFFISCDIIENPLKEQTGNTCGDESLPVPIRKVLVEDYTGQKCNNCPVAAINLVEIKEDYCDYIIPIAIHVGSFATPTPPIFPNDFRTDAGNELNTFYNVDNFGLPQGMVSRTEFDGNTVLSKDNWRAAVHALVQIPPDADIRSVVEFDTVTNKITATISVTILNDLNQELNLGVYLTEDSVISAQLTFSGVVYDYVHRHMLRAAPLGAFGEKIVDSAKKGDVLHKTLTFEANEIWIPKHCELVLFLSKKSTGEIIQAESENINLK
jgi:hypothetical protein